VCRRGTFVPPVGVRFIEKETDAGAILGPVSRLSIGQFPRPFASWRVPADCVVSTTVPEYLPLSTGEPFEESASAITIPEPGYAKAQQRDTGLWL
jgi:hypothetical protein